MAQRDVAQTIIRVGRERGMGPREIVAALSTGLVESGLQNLSFGDRDSVGVFQQRPSQGWGSPSQLQDVEFAANQFYDAISRFDRPNISGAELAARIQRPAAQFRDRYAQRWGEAENIYRQLAGSTASGVQRYIPVQGVTTTQLTDTFGADRSGGRSHRGIDIFADQGTPVIAVVGGTVTRAGPGGNLSGNRVWVRDDQGLYHFYAHMSNVDVREGQRVEAGERLGGVGNTGNARNTPPHLHYSVNPSSSSSEQDAINPYEYLTGAGSVDYAFGGVPGPMETFAEGRRRARDVMGQIMAATSRAASAQGGKVLSVQALLGEPELDEEGRPLDADVDIMEEDTPFADNEERAREDREEREEPFAGFDFERWQRRQQDPNRDVSEDVTPPQGVGIRSTPSRS